jgi:hypothetical protein
VAKMKQIDEPFLSLPWHEYYTVVDETGLKILWLILI